MRREYWRICKAQCAGITIVEEAGIQRIIELSMSARDNDGTLSLNLVMAGSGAPPRCAPHGSSMFLSIRPSTMNVWKGLDVAEGRSVD
jgi:hypothetical protein